MADKPPYFNFEIFLDAFSSVLNALEYNTRSLITFQDELPYFIIDEITSLIDSSIVVFIAKNREKPYSNAYGLDQRLVAKIEDDSELLFSENLKGYRWKVEAVSEDFYNRFSLLDYRSIRYCTTLSDKKENWKINLLTPEAPNLTRESFEKVEKCILSIGSIYKNLKKRRFRPIEIKNVYEAYLSSSYINVILKELLDQLNDALAKKHNSRDDFSFQFYARVDSGPNLRIYPLPHQVDRFNANGFAKPNHVLRSYIWNTKNSVVAHAYETGCSQFIRRIQLEPLFNGLNLNPREKQQREEATSAMRALRPKGTLYESVLVVPVFAHSESIGVLSINLNSLSAAQDRALLVRLIRSTTKLFSLIISTDKTLNQLAEEKKRAFRSRAYKHLLKSFFHGESTYASRNFRLFATVRGIIKTAKDNRDANHTDDCPLHREVSEKSESINVELDILEHVIREKKVMTDDVMKLGDESGSDDYLKQVHPDVIYGRENLTYNKSIVAKLLEVQRQIHVDPEAWKFSFNLDWKVNELSGLGELNPEVVSLILSNMFSNSAKAHKIRSETGEEGSVSFLLKTDLKEKFLTIEAVDDCGGFEETAELRFPKTIDSDVWTRFVEEDGRPLSRRPEFGGTGFYIMARVASGAGGQFMIDTVKRGSRLGAKVSVRLKMYRHLSVL